MSIISSIDKSVVDTEYRKKFGSPNFKLINIPSGKRQKEINSDRYKNSVIFLKIEFEKINVLDINVINSVIIFVSSV
jgi:hypothetical protein